MAKTLHMVFSIAGRSKTVSVADPKEDLSQATVDAVMNTIVGKSAFVADTDAVDGIKDAYYREIITTNLV